MAKEAAKTIIVYREVNKKISARTNWLTRFGVIENSADAPRASQSKNFTKTKSNFRTKKIQ